MQTERDILGPDLPHGSSSMKTLATVTLGLVVAAATLPALAATKDREHLARCNADIERALGADTRTRLAGIKSSRDGNRLRIKATPTQGDSLVVTCWVDSEGMTHLVDAGGVALQAATFGETDKVSLTD